MAEAAAAAAKLDPRLLAKSMEEDSAPEVTALKALIYPSDYDPEAPPKPAKRKKDADGAGGASAPKKSKVATVAPTNAEVLAHIENGTLKKLTVAILKEILRVKGQPTSGKKGELVQRIERIDFSG